MKKIKNGFFIAIEGIDGSGKSSLVNFLSQELSRLDFFVIKTREPGGTKLGITLREIITTADRTRPGAGGPLGLDNFDKQSHEQEVKQINNAIGFAPIAEFLLFAADRAQHVYSVINPALKQGAIVISDRGSDSSLAYQGYGKGLDLEMISGINHWILADTKPDLVIYLKLDYKTAIDRVLSRGETITSFEKKGQEFFNRVINGFNEIFYVRSQELPSSIIEIDASQSEEIVKKEALNKVLKIRAFQELR